MNKGKINIVLVNATIDSENMGCVALSYSVGFLIDKVLKSEEIYYNLSITGYYKKSECKLFKFKDTNIYYQTVVCPTIVGLKDLLTKILRIKNFLSSRRVFNQSHIILNLGEGDSFSDIYGTHRFDLISRFIKAAIKYNKPHYFFPQTIGPFKNNKVKQRAIKYLKCAQAVMVRDKMSLDVVKDFDNSIDVKEYIDLAFVLPFAKYNFAKDKIHVGVNVSALLWNGGYTRNNQFRLKSNYKCLITKIINNILQADEKIQIHLISHVFSLVKDGIENDFSVMNDIYKDFNNPRITLAPLSFDPVEVKSYIAGMDFFIGSRMHATIAAFSAGIPVLPLAYSRKFNGLFVETLNYPYMSDLKTQDAEEVIKMVNDSFKERETMRDLIQDRLDNIVRPRIDILKNDIRDILLKFAK